jgi:hypothetical protein
MSSQSANFLQASPEIAVDGGLDSVSLQHLIENFKSVLYICKDDLFPPSSDFGYDLLRILYRILLLYTRKYYHSN